MPEVGIEGDRMKYFSRLRSMLLLPVCAGLCALLAGCVFLPGKFSSELDIRRDGSFSYRYAGELVFAKAEERPAEQWHPSQARCFHDKTDDERPCTLSEAEAQRQLALSIEQARFSQAKEIEALVGFNPYDRAANIELAERMSGVSGWQKVEYKGAGVFDVVYEVSGMLDRDFVFPLMPETKMFMPIVIVRRISDDIIEVDAPGFSTSALRGLLRQTVGNKNDDAEIPVLNRADGTFTLKTNATLTHFGEASRATHAIGDKPGQFDEVHSVQWTVKGTLEKSPQVRLILGRD